MPCPIRARRLKSGPRNRDDQASMTATALPQPNTPLAGITVLDFGQIYQGPYATVLMARAGADVIKIEPPTGEPLRRNPAGPGTRLAFAMLNSNKRAITLNLKSDRGRALLIEMARRADVLLENFSPGTLDDLGVGYEVLRAANPRLVYATGTGFGISGPDRDTLAMDLTIQAASGIMSVTGDPDGPPTKAGPTLVDYMGGIHLYGAVMTALFQRERTGRGQLVEVAMQEAVYSTLASSFEYYVRTGKVPPRTGNRQAGLASAPYNVFATTDGYVAIHGDGDVAVGGGEDVIGRARQPSLAVAGAWRHLSGAHIVFEAGGQGGIHRLLHRHLDELAAAGPFALKQRGHHSA